MWRKWIAVAAVFLPFAGYVAASPDGGARESTFTIVHTNDFHGRHLPFRAVTPDATSQTDDPGEADTYRFGRTAGVGGLAQLAAVVKRLRAQSGSNDSVLLLHAGDTFSDDLLGNLTEGEAVVRVMDRLGYDFTALGNHDFDYGPQRTRELQDMVSFPMRAANIIDRSTGEPVHGSPIQVLERGGVKVGLLAMGYTHTPWTASKKSVKGLEFKSAVETARQYVPELRRQADVVVVVSHLGTTGDEVLAREVDGIDLIIGGHSHDHLAPAKQIGGTRIVQALSDGAEYGVVEVAFGNGKVVDVRSQVKTLWSDEVEPDAEVEQQIAALREPHRQRLEQTIFTAAGPIPREYKSESPFDKLVGEILIQETGADVAMLPGVGYGLTLGPGPVSREQLYTLLAHPAKVAAVTLSGAQIQRTLEQSATNQKPAEPLDTVGGLIQTVGIEWTADLTQPPGQRVRDVRIGGEPLDPERSYRVATHSGMLGGIHRYDELGKGSAIQRTDTKVVDAVEQALMDQGKVRAPQTGEVKLILAQP